MKIVKEIEKLLCDICYNKDCICRVCKKVGQMCEMDLPGASGGCGYTSEEKMPCFEDALTGAVK